MRADSERGSISVELAVLTPVLIIVLALIIAAGRVAIAGGAIEGVAAAAARQASLARTADQARTDATSTARRVLDEQGLQCVSSSVDVDTSGFAVPVGRPASVRVDVTCRVALSDLGVPGMPGTRELHDSFVSELDPFRGRDR